MSTLGYSQNYKPKKNKESGGEYGGYAVKKYSDLKAFQLTRIWGEINFKGLYREQNKYFKDFHENEKYSLYSGGIILRTNSYVLHPNFLTLDLDAEYNPEKLKDTYLIVPDRAEANNIKKFDGRATFFKEKHVSFTALGGYSEAYSNRENITNIKGKNLNYGGLFAIRNSILPATISYNDRKWNQLELDTKRKFEGEQRNLEAKYNLLVFKRYYKDEFSYNYNEFFRRDAKLFEVKNISNQIKLTNEVAFDRKRNYVFNSILTGINQTGYDEFKRLNSYQRIFLKLPENLNFNGSYNFYSLDRFVYKLNQHRVNSKLSHKLYESLFSNIFFDYSKADHTLFDETNYSEGIDLLYKKKIPTGLLTISYRYERLRQIKSGSPVDVINEEYKLTDGQIILLAKPYINRSSVLVTDETGTIIYQENFDYILIERDNFLEIQRMPGGQIANNASVYVDYTATQSATYQYDSNNHLLFLSVQFLKWFEIYGRYSTQNFVNQKQTEFLILNYFNQYVYGARFDFSFINGGAEYDDYRSTVIPYKLMRYYISLNGTIKQKFMYSLNGSLRDYKMINNEVNQRYTDIAGSLGYMLNTRTKFMVNCGYRNQTGKQIDLDLFTVKAEFTTSLRQLYFTFGVDYYNKKYLTESIDFKGAYVRIVRKF